MAKYVLALDQGTTSSRAILFDKQGTVVGVAQKEFSQILPEPGHVEHDPEEIWNSQLTVAQNVLQQKGASATDVAAIGITNQRETVVIWEKETGRPIDNAIVWQSRITAPICEQLKDDGHSDSIRQKTGLIVDAYFSGSKVKYLLDQHDPDRSRAKKGELLFGTVDSFLIWRLTGGAHHVTDVSNASRTMLFNIHKMEWDDELLALLSVPRQMLPQVVPSSQVYGQTTSDFFGASIPIAGCAGDQQAALFGQSCFEIGDAKNTYGTGCFLLMNTGSQAVESHNNLLTTVAWQIGDKVTYCLEGSVFICGAVVQWLRDGLGIIQSSEEVEQLASKVENSEGVFFVPAFVGLGAPHWDPYARGLIVGLTRGTTAAHLARAAVESMAYQSKDLIDAMKQDAKTDVKVLRVDGGASVNNRLMQFQADIQNTMVHRPVVAETTALGAAYLAGLAVGFWNDLDDVRQNWQLDREFKPEMDQEKRDALCQGWQEAVRRSLKWVQPDG